MRSTTMRFAPDIGGSFDVDLTKIDQTQDQLPQSGDAVIVVDVRLRAVSTTPARESVAMLSLLLLASVAVAQPGPLPLDTIRLPQGFSIELVARVDNARQM